MQFIYKYTSLMALSQALVHSLSRFVNAVKSFGSIPLVLLFGALLAHYVSVHYYAYYCTPWGVWGMVQTLWRVESVQCKATRWVFTYSYNYLHHFWISFGGACVAWATKWFKRGAQQ